MRRQSPQHKPGEQNNSHHKGPEPVFTRIKSCARLSRWKTPLPEAGRRQQRRFASVGSAFAGGKVALLGPVAFVADDRKHLQSVARPQLTVARWSEVQVISPTRAAIG
jgi:hypothetical protein